MRVFAIALGVVIFSLAAPVTEALARVAYAIDTILILAPYMAGAATVALGIAGWSMRRSHRRLALASAIGAAANSALLTFAYYAAFAPSPGLAHNDGLRIVSFNVWKGAADHRSAITWLVRQDADLIVILEGDEKFHHSAGALRQRYPYRYDCLGNGRCSTLILSRVQADRVAPLGRGDTENRGGLSALRAQFTVRGETISLTAVHLVRPWPFDDQRIQLAALTDAVSQESTPQVVIGDFNSAPWTIAMRSFAKKSGVRAMSGNLPSWPADGVIPPVLPLDEIYVSPGVETSRITRSPSLGSDHRAIMVNVSR